MEVAPEWVTMSISPDQLKKFIDLYKEQYGIILNEEKAKEEFFKLAELYRNLYLIDPTNPV
jgi:hypothetical protein